MSIKKPSTFSVLGLPPGIFGEAYVVVSVWQASTTTWMAEYSILAKRPQKHLFENLFSRVVEIDITSYSSELEPIDEAYMEAEATRQAELDLMLELEKRAADSGHTELAYLPIALQRTKISLVTLWMRTLFAVTLEDMANHTNSSDLNKYLRIVVRLQRAKAGLRSPDAP
ncbi:MAG: hypothetical protein Q8Q73_03020 [Stagnimonas sp.]|nr:hypothetical protein [Stagnimonas sp.]